MTLDRSTSERGGMFVVEQLRRVVLVPVAVVLTFWDMIRDPDTFFFGPLPGEAPIEHTAGNSISGHPLRPGREN